MTGPPAMARSDVSVGWSVSTWASGSAGSRPGLNSDTSVISPRRAYPASEHVVACAGGLVGERRLGVVLPEPAGKVGDLRDAGEPGAVGVLVACEGVNGADAAALVDKQRRAGPACASVRAPWSYMLLPRRFHPGSLTRSSVVSGANRMNAV